MLSISGDLREHGLLEKAARDPEPVSCCGLRPLCHGNSQVRCDRKEQAVQLYSNRIFSRKRALDLSPSQRADIYDEFDECKVWSTLLVN